MTLQQTRSSRSRVAVCFWRLGPYHHARLEAASRFLDVSAIEFTSQDEFYEWDTVQRNAAFETISLHGHYQASWSGKRAARKKMFAALSRTAPVAVAIPGWSLTDALCALAWCIETRTPAIVMSESSAHDASRRPVAEWVKRRIVRMFSAGVVGGVSHFEYLQELGMPAERIQLGYDVVDNEHFLRRASAAREEATRLRSKHGLPECYFLASARFVEKKNLLRLIDAYAAYRERVARANENRFGVGNCEPGNSPLVPWLLVLLGDGPLRQSIEGRIAELQLNSAVLLPGFRQYNELPDFYGLAGAFVHASTVEQWGLVVNEAMASGLPVVVSDRCGCARDLVRPGANGFVFDPEDVSSLADCMFQVGHISDIRAMSECSREVIANWGPQRFGAALYSAVLSVAGAVPPDARRCDRLLLRTLLQTGY